MKKQHSLLALPLAMLFASAALGSNFTGATNDQWFDATNWTGGVPTAATSTVINNFADARLDMAGAVAADLRIGIGATLDMDGQDINVTSLDIQSTGSSLIGGGTLTASGAGSDIGGGSITGGATANFNGLAITSDGAVSIASSTVNTAGDTTWGSQGTVTLSGTTTWTNTGNFTRTQSGAVGGLNLQDSASFVNEGTFTVTGGNTFDADTMNSSVFTNNGAVVVDGANSVFNVGNYADGASSSVTVSGGGRLQSSGNLAISNAVGGTGTIQAGTVTVSGGTVTPGNSIGQLDVTGNLTMDSDAVLEIELGSGGLTDLLAVSGTATLTQASLNVVLEQGFMAAVDDTFQFLNAGSLSGTFSNAPNNLDQLMVGGYTFDVQYSATGARLQVSAVPEPTGLAMLGVVALGATIRRRRRR